MDLKRYFRGPFVAVLVVLLVFFVVYKYASSGTSYKQADTSHVISLIEQGQVKSALLIDNEQTIQVTTSQGSRCRRPGWGTRARSWPSAAGATPPAQGYNVEVPKGSSLWR